MIKLAARLALLLSTAFAIIATSEVRHNSPLCSGAAGTSPSKDAACVKPHACTAHGTNEASPLDDEAVQCDDTPYVTLGAPPLLHQEDLARLGGVYLYVSPVETFGVEPAAALPELQDPFTLALYGDTYLGLDLPQPRLRLSWQVPVKTGDTYVDTTFPSGFVYLPLTTETRQAIDGNKDRLADSYESSLDIFFTYTPQGKSPLSGHVSLPVASQGHTELADADPAATFTVDDGLFMSSAFVAQTHPAAPTAAAPVAFLALHFSDVPDLPADPGTVIKVRHKDNGDVYPVGWSAGPDGQLLLAAVATDAGPLVVEVAPTLKSKSGKAFAAGAVQKLNDNGVEIGGTP